MKTKFKKKKTLFTLIIKIMGSAVVVTLIGWILSIFTPFFQNLFLSGENSKLNINKPVITAIKIYNFDQKIKKGETTFQFYYNGIKDVDGLINNFTINFLDIDDTTRFANIINKKIKLEKDKLNTITFPWELSWPDGYFISKLTNKKNSYPPLIKTKMEIVLPDGKISTPNKGEKPRIGMSLISYICVPAPELLDISEIGDKNKELGSYKLTYQNKTYNCLYSPKESKIYSKIINNKIYVQILYSFNQMILKTPRVTGFPLERIYVHAILKDKIIIMQERNIPIGVVYNLKNKKYITDFVWSIEYSKLYAFYLYHIIEY
ncbi:MAG: hypothetical protein ACTSRG_24020 [Candidatus Helarchaeota archaeon]